MKSNRVPDERTISAILICLLSAMILLGSSSGPPLVAISAIPTVEGGTTVKVLGILVDLRLYDSGAEGMIVADLKEGAVAKVVSTSGIGPQPSAFTRIGDELLIEGAVSVSEASVVIFTTGDDVSISRKSELVLTVEAVSRNWFLFEGDIVRIKGVLERTGSSTGLRLCDSSGNNSIAVLPVSLDLRQHVGSPVTLTAIVKFDYRLSALTLVPSYAVAEQ